jgi:outer membrane protein
VETEAQESALSDRIRYEVHEAYLGYLLAVKKIDSYNQAVDQATENYKIVKNKYDNTLATTTDLLDADIARLQTKLNYAFSKADASTAYSKLLQVSGELDKAFEKKPATK